MSDSKKGKKKRPPAEWARAEALRMNKGEPGGSLLKSIVDLNNRVEQKVKAHLEAAKTEPSRKSVEEAFNAALASEAILLSRAERVRLLEQITAEVVGFGPLEVLLADPDISEILVDGPRKVYVERKGKMHDAPVTFRDEAHLMAIIRRIVEPAGRRIDESHPFVDIRLWDGSRVNVVIPPIALNGPTLTIRKFFAKALPTADELLRFGTCSESMLEFLRLCVRGRVSIAISGGTGSGKTALLNTLGGFIPNDERRIIVVQNVGELNLPHKYVVTLETRPPNLAGRGEVTARDLVQNALHMRPDRIILAEAHWAEVLDMIQAMNSGHDGSLLTLHANNAHDALSRLEVMAASANPTTPLLVLREQIQSAVQLVVHIERLRDGSRKIVAITEVDGLQGDVIRLNEVFRFEHQGFEGGKVAGRFAATGHIPNRILDHLKQANIEAPARLFRT